MKKFATILIALTCLLSALFSFACADGSGTWICPTCGLERDSEWCPICGVRRTSSDTWICTTCGNEWSSEYNFCPNDRTVRPVSSGTWPVRSFTGVSTALKPLKTAEDRHQSFLGPDNHTYDGAGAYKPYKVSSAIALFREGDYVLVDLDYTTVGKRCVYFKASSLTNDHAEDVILTSSPATTTRRVQPYYGPSTTYNSVVRKWKDTRTGLTKTEDIWLTAATDIQVFFETNGWVFTEFYSSIGLTRAWLPADAVRAN